MDENRQQRKTCQWAQEDQRSHKYVYAFTFPPLSVAYDLVFLPYIGMGGGGENNLSEMPFFHKL